MFVTVRVHVILGGEGGGGRPSLFLSLCRSQGCYGAVGMDWLGGGGGGGGLPRIPPPHPSSSLNGLFSIQAGSNLKSRWHKRGVSQAST